METPHIKTSHRGEVAPNVYSDFTWIHEHRPELLEKYGSCIILVYQRTVVGTGETLREAEEDAERRLPPGSGQITPVIEFLSRQHPFSRVYLERIVSGQK
jgi:hypothetical protein